MRSGGALRPDGDRELVGKPDEGGVGCSRCLVAYRAMASRVLPSLSEVGSGWFLPGPWHAVPGFPLPLCNSLSRWPSRELSRVRVRRCFLQPGCSRSPAASRGPKIGLEMENCCA